MRGLMMNSPLLVTSFIDRAADLFGGVEIVSRRADRSIHRYTPRRRQKRTGLSVSVRERHLPPRLLRARPAANETPGAVRLTFQVVEPR